MKRCFSIITLLFGAVLAFAQAGPGKQGQFLPGTDSGPGQFQNAVTIQGTLGFVNGRIAVKSGETTYYVSGLNRLFGFVDGLKEGAAVALEGYAVEIPAAPEYRYFFTEKLNFNGREYAGLLPARRVELALSGGPGFPQGSPPPGGTMRERRHQRRPSPPPPPHHFYYRDR
ncbi:MAG: hypothetical protein LBP80_02215 [Treponema sp.]|nr:hypothetical protein [Treponema sp.]